MYKTCNKYNCRENFSGGEILHFIREAYNFNEGFPFQLFETSAKQDIVHNHNCLEINFVQRGSGYYLIEHKNYPIMPGDIFIINNEERHMAVHDEDFSLVVMVFDSRFVWANPKEYDYLGAFFNRSTNFSNRISNVTNEYKELRDYIDKIQKEYEKGEDGWQLVVKATVMLFLAVLYRYLKKNREIGQDMNNLNKQYERIYPMLDFIHEHYKEDINLEELSKIVMLNKTYMCSFFKDNMNMTIFEYIQKVRISQCCRLLKTTKEPITDIALECGFNGISYFNRSFKESLGVTPKQYRENPNIVQV